MVSQVFLSNGVGGSPGGTEPQWAPRRDRSGRVGFLVTKSVVLGSRGAVILHIGGGGGSYFVLCDLTTCAKPTEPRMTGRGRE